MGADACCSSPGSANCRPARRNFGSGKTSFSSSIDCGFLGERVPSLPGRWPSTFTPFTTELPPYIFHVRLVESLEFHRAIRPRPGWRRAKGPGTFTRGCWREGVRTLLHERPDPIAEGSPCRIEPMAERTRGCTGAVYSLHSDLTGQSRSGGGVHSSALTVFTLP